MNDHRQAVYTNETNAAETDEAEPKGVGERGESIGIGGGDENVVKVQLAARWTETFAPADGDTLEEALRRFRRAYSYIDAVTKLIEPDPA